MADDEPIDEVEVNLLDLAADPRGQGPPGALGRRLPEMVAQLLNAAGMAARHGSATVRLDRMDAAELTPGALAWAVPAGELEEGEAIALSRRLGPAKLLAYGELGPERRQGMALKVRVLRREDGGCVLKLSRRFFREEVADAAHAVARAIADLADHGADVAQLDVAAVLGTSSSSALLSLHQGLDILEGLESGLAGGDLVLALGLLIEAAEEDPACGIARQHAVTAIARHTSGLLSLERGVELGRRLAAASPGHEEVTVLLARLLQRGGELEQALQLLGSTAGDDPRGPIALELARLHLARGELERALTLARQALEAEDRLAATRHAEALEIQGLVLARTSQVDAARQHFEHATRLDPDNPRLWANLARCFHLLDKPRAARKAYDRSRELAPENWDVAQRLSELLVEEGDLEGARDLLEEWRRHRPDDPQPVLSLAELLARQPARLEEARRMLEAAAAAHHDDARVLSLLGGVLVQAGEHEAAETRYRAALRLRPDDPALLSNLALVLSHLGRVAEAEPLARQAVDLAPHDLVSRKVLEHVRGKN